MQKAGRGLQTSIELVEVTTVVGTFSHQDTFTRVIKLLIKASIA